ncbi:hypothetical protein AMECASPLE_007968 [Ameca splendens]|uniref:Uncharacterized protein n=1 Tax=Ameca splendens TaxID=208324 RepID=A0ABV0XNS5_9TELE
MFNLHCENKSSVVNWRKKTTFKVFTKHTNCAKACTLEELPQYGLSTHTFPLPCYYQHSLAPLRQEENTFWLDLRDNNHNHPVLNAVATKEFIHHWMLLKLTLKGQQYQLLPTMIKSGLKGSSEILNIL